MFIDISRKLLEAIDPAIWYGINGVCSFIVGVSILLALVLYLDGNTIINKIKRLSLFVVVIGCTLNVINASHYVLGLISVAKVDPVEVILNIGLAGVALTYLEHRKNVC